MSTHITRAILMAVLTHFSSLALAAPDCTKEPQSKWMTQDAMKAKAEAQGVKISRFLISGNCYEIYGHDKNGKKVEIYFDPVDGHTVKQRGG
jgi:hypothetical protein